MKEEFKKDLLEKVYPIGSYYWSEKDISPEELFGGKWEKIEGRFLFASDSNHKVGETGGEERHKLTIDEMPNHSHEFKTHVESIFASNKGYGEAHMGNSTATTSSTGNSQPHNNMPPYLTANCWKRVEGGVDENNFLNINLFNEYYKFPKFC